MNMHTTARHQNKLFALAAKAAARLAGWAVRTAKVMNAGMPPVRHRMGSWEKLASFRARAMQDASRE